jgi:hypothetical protein
MVLFIAIQRVAIDEIKVDFVLVIQNNLPNMVQITMLLIES